MKNKNCGKILKKSTHYTKFRNILREFKKIDIHLVLQKNIYPYERINNYNKFKEQLPLNKKD